MGTYRPKFSTILIYFGFALTGVATTLLGSALPALMSRFSLSDAQAGYLFAAQFLSSTAGVVLSGRLAASFGFKRTLVPGFLFIAVGIASLGFVVGWLTCMAAVSCYGVGLGVAIPACNLQVAAVNPDRRASALNTLNFVWTGGALAWAPFAAITASRPISFVLMGGFIAAFTLCLALSPLPERERAEARATSITSIDRGISLSVYAATATMFFLYVGVENAWGGWATSYAKRMNGVTETWILASSFFWGALLFGRAVAPWLLKRISEEVLLTADLVVATLAGCLVLMTSTTTLLFIALMALGFALSSIFPNVIAKMTRDFESRPGDAGWMFAAAGVGGATLPWAVGVASSHFGAMRVGLAVPIAGSAVMLMIQILRSRGTSRAVAAGTGV